MEILGYYSKNLDKCGIQCGIEKDRTALYLMQYSIPADGPGGWGGGGGVLLEWT